MAMKDCIAKLKRAGVTVTESHIKALDAAVAEGLTEDQAVRRVALSAQRNVVDITLRAQSEGATLSPVANPVTDLAKFQSKALTKISDRKTEINKEIAVHHEAYLNVVSLEGHVRESRTLSGIPMDVVDGRSIWVDLNNDQQVLDVMIQMTFKPELERGRKAMGLTGDTALEMLQSFRDLQDTKQEHIDGIHGLALEEIALDERVSKIFSGAGDQTFYQLGKDVPALTVRHNLTAGNLTFTDDLGGLAVPSLAVLPHDQPMTGFGEITLIGTEDLGDPAKLPIFDADGYTVRFPSAEYKPATAGVLDPIIKEATIWAREWEGQHSDLTYYVDRHMKDHPNPQLVIWKMLDSPAMQAWYLTEMHGENLTPTEKDVKPRFRWGWDDEIIEFFANAPSPEKWQWEDPKRTKLLKDAAAVVTKVAVRSLMKRPTTNKISYTKEEAQSIFESGAFLNRDGSLSETRFRELSEDAKRKGTKELDRLPTIDLLNSRLDIGARRHSFKAWVEQKVVPNLGEPRIKIGGKWHPYNLENITRKMKGKLKGSEFMDNMMNEGLMRALAAHRFKRLEEMRQRSEMVIEAPDEVKVLREAAQAQMLAWTSQMPQFYVHAGANGYVDAYEASDEARRAIVEWAGTSERTGLDLEAALERHGFEDTPDWLIDEGMMAGMDWLAVPVPYFEAKPQRAVMLEEFAGAVIPADSTPETRAILQKRGILYKEYQVGANIDEYQTRIDATAELTQQLNNMGERTLFQSEIGFTSGLETAAQTMPREKGTAQEMLATLMKQPNVKRREMEWLGLNEWALARGSFTREELVEFIGEGGIRIEEQVLSETPAHIVTVEDVKAAWDEGSFDANDIRVATMTDEQIEKWKFARGKVAEDRKKAVGLREAGIRAKHELQWEDLTQEQIHEQQAKMQRKQGTAVGYFGTEEEQLAATDRLERARLAFSGSTEGVTQAELNAQRDEFHAAGEAMTGIVPGWGHADRGDGTYLIDGPEAASWQLAGEDVFDKATNYREIILKLPSVDPSVLDATHHAVLAGYQQLSSEQREALNEHYVRTGQSSRARKDDAFLNALRMGDVTPADFIAAGLEWSGVAKAYMELSMLRDAAAGEFKSHVFRDFGNIVGWFRVNDRVGPNGEKIFHIEETQSDFAKAIRKKGARSEWAIEVMQERADELNEMATALADVRDPKTNKIAEEGRWHELKREFEFLLTQINAEKAKAKAMPFDGNAWVELIMKRAIRLAAEGGYDQISWTTGQQQAKRYNLERHVTKISSVNRVTYDENDSLIDAGRAVTLTRPEAGGEMRLGVTREGVIDNVERGTPAHWKGKTLEEAIGGPLADQILAHDGLLVQEGQDLKVGGEGMKAFYDKLLVNTANKVARKLDKKVRVKKFQQLAKPVDRTKDLPPLTKIYPPGFGGAYEVDWRYEYRGNVPTGDYDTKAEAMAAAWKQYDAEHDKKFGVQHTLDITPQMAEAALEGQTLFQEGKRGAITFRGKEGAIIRMKQAKDLSTFLHESAHLYLEMMGDLVEMEGASKRLIDDYAKILTYLGVNHRREIRSEHHELFARSYEAWLREGKAPTAELQPLFTTFGGWFQRVYRQLNRLLEPGEALDDEIRGVFDRMVASDAAISQSEDMMEYVQLYQTAEEMGVSQEVFDVYKRAMQESHDEEVDKLTRKEIKAMQWSQQQWWNDERKKVAEQVRADAEQMPVYKALAMLQKGKLPDGTDANNPFKLDKQSLLDLLDGSQAFLKSLPGAGRYAIYALKNGVDVDVAADVLGFESAKAMIDTIANAAPMEDYIKAESTRIMEENHPNPLNSTELIDEATRSVHNNKRGQVLGAELRALRKQQKADAKIVKATKDTAKREEREAREANKGQMPKREDIASIKAAATHAISLLKIRNVNPNTYLQSERKAGRLAFEAMGRKDYAEAYRQKRAQVMHFWAYKAAIAAKTQADRDHKYLKGFEKEAKRKRMGKAGYLPQIEAVLEAIDLRKLSLTKMDRLKIEGKLVAAIEAGEIVTTPEIMATLSASQGTNWRDLTVQEFAGIRDIVKQLEHQARTDLKTIINGEEIVIQEAVDAVAGGIIENNKKVNIPRAGETAGQSAKRSVKEGVGHWLRSSSIARVLDKSGFGAVTRHIIVPIRRAYVEKLIPAQQKAAEDVAKLYQKHYSNNELSKLGKPLPDLTMGEKMSKADILALALNWGSESNRRAVLGGMMVDENGNKTPAYTQDGVAQALGRMDARDWAFVQDIWDYQNSYWDQLAETEKRRRGIAPEKIESLPFDIRTVDGDVISLRGGYHHLQYDSRHSGKTTEKEWQDYFNKMTNGGYLSSSTRAGSTHNRVQDHGKVVRLSLSTIDQNLREITRDMAIGDEVNLINRILTSKEVARAAGNTGNAELLTELKLWLSDAAVGELPAQSVVEKALSWGRVGFTKSKLAFNVYVTALQLTGIFQSMVVIGKGNYMRGAGKFLSNPVANYKSVMERSKFMEARYGILQTWDKDVNDTNAYLQSMFGAAPTRGKQMFDTVGHYYFYPIAKMQSVVDVTTWMGAYEGALNDPQVKSEEEAVYAADAAVEAAQTSGLFSDRSGIERGTLGSRTRQGQFVRLWTTLVSYMLAKGNIAYEKGINTNFRNPKEVMHFATDMALLFLIEGMASAYLYGQGPEEEENPWLWAAEVTGESVLAGIPLVREFTSSRYASGNTPVGALFMDSYKFFEQAAQGEADEAAIKAGIKVTGTLFHLPASQPNRAVEAMFKDDAEVYEYILGTTDE
jgi:hypothetical protein